MAKILYATIEEAAAALNIEVTEANKPILMSLVKKEKGVVPSANKRKELMEKAESIGLTGLDAEKETVDSLKIRIIQHLYGEARVEEMEEFAKAHNLAVDDDGRVFRVKAAVKPIEERNAGSTPGSTGALSIALLQDERYANKTIAELAELFPAYAEEQGVPGKTTTQSSLQWYVNYCRKHGIEIIERKRNRAVKTEGGKALGAELTLDKALAPRGFAKKAKPEGNEAGTGENLDLD